MPRTWPHTGEDRLLDAHWKATGPGTLYVEVGIGGPGSPWPGSSERRIDGVIARAGAENVVREKSQFQPSLGAERPWTAVDLIEVKVGLSEGVIGQALAAKWMFEQQHGAEHGVDVHENIVLYRHEDAAMKWVAEKLGLTTLRRDAPEKNNPMRARPHYHLRDGDIARVAAYRGRVRGQIITRIPIGGPASGVDAWAGSAQTHVKYVRAIRSPLEETTVFEGRDSFVELAATHGLELVVVQPKLNRGAIGVAEAHALMLVEQYGVRIDSRVVVCQRSDPALQAACAARGIEVHVVDLGDESEDLDAREVE